jgi:hypothetical protein
MISFHIDAEADEEFLVNAEIGKVDFQVTGTPTCRPEPFDAREACTNIHTISRSMGHTITSVMSHPGLDIEPPGTWP